jgi:hypothetical protein
VNILTEEDVYRIASRLPVEDVNKLLTHFHSSTTEIIELTEELRVHVQENKSIATNNDLIRKENQRLQKELHNSGIHFIELINKLSEEQIRNKRLEKELEECKKDVAFWLENSFKWSQKERK